MIFKVFIEREGEALIGLRRGLFVCVLRRVAKVRAWAEGRKTRGVGSFVLIWPEDLMK